MKKLKHFGAYLLDIAKILYKTLRSKKFWIVIGIFLSYYLIFWFGSNYTLHGPVKNIQFQPIIQKRIKDTVSDTKTPEIAQNNDISSQPSPTPTPKKTTNWGDTRVVEGIASYYSEDGCEGCDDNLIMANGERLDDTKFTIALPVVPVRELKLMNKMIKVMNVANDVEVVAKVTDTGGFDKLGRVADMSLALKEALSCPDLCNVILEL